MKAVLHDAPRRFSVATLPTPEPGPGEVRVAMAATGVCGPHLHSALEAVRSDTSCLKAAVEL